MYADPEVMRHIGDGRTLNRWETWRAIAASLGHWVLRGYGQWVVEEGDTGAVCGRAGLYNPEGWPGLEVGYALARDHWGKGYATEAAGRALRYAFEVLGVETAQSLILPENRRSIRVAERLGGIRDGSVDVVGKEALVFRYSTSSR